MHDQCDWRRMAPELAVAPTKYAGSCAPLERGPKRLGPRIAPRPLTCLASTLLTSCSNIVNTTEVARLADSAARTAWRAEFLEAEAVVRCRCTFFFALGFAAIGAGCSNIGTDSALPSETELPKAGYRIVLVDDGPGGSDGCHSPTHTATMGDVTDTTAPHLVSEAEGATVECRVARVGLEAGGEGFAVSVNLRNARNRLVVSIPSLAAWSTPSDPALGHVVIASPETGGDYSSPAESPCHFYFREAPQYASTGRAWVEFECANVTNGPSTCRLGDLEKSYINSLVALNCDH